MSRARDVRDPVDDVHSSLLQEAASLQEATVVDSGSGKRAVDALDADVRQQAVHGRIRRRPVLGGQVDQYEFAA